MIGKDQETTSFGCIRFKLSVVNKIGRDICKQRNTLSKLQSAAQRSTLYPSSFQNNPKTHTSKSSKSLEEKRHSGQLRGPKSSRVTDEGNQRQQV